MEKGEITCRFPPSKGPGSSGSSYLALKKRRRDKNLAWKVVYREYLAVPEPHPAGGRCAGMRVRPDSPAPLSPPHAEKKKHPERGPKKHRIQPRSQRGIWEFHLFIPHPPSINLPNRGRASPGCFLPPSSSSDSAVFSPNGRARA